MGNASIDDALLGTVMPNFKIMPAWGAALPDPSFTLQDQAVQWGQLLSALEARADFVIVDTPSGMLGPVRPDHALRTGMTVSPDQLRGYIAERIGTTE